MSVLVTQQAPDFTAAAVLANGSIVDDFQLSSLRVKDCFILLPVGFYFCLSI